MSAGSNDPIATDGVVTLRAARPGDAQLLVSGSLQVARAGNGGSVACVWVGDRLVGWVDYDLERDWLQPGEVNVGYYLFPDARGKGYASRAVELLLRHLKRDTPHTGATLLIHPENVRSLALACRLGFVEHTRVSGARFFIRGV